MLEMKAKTIIRGSGKAQGEAIVLNQPLWIFAQVNWVTGELSDECFGECNGISIKDRVLFVTYGIASSGTVLGMNEIKSCEVAPAAIVQVEYPDTPTTEGCLMAGVPMLCHPDKDPFACVKTGDWVEIDANTGRIQVTSR